MQQSENLDEATLKKLHATMLEMLDEFSRFCQENDIVWWLDSGNALGAARHKGFIPWDDDIDIGMLRPDYDRFISLAHKKLPEGLTLHTAHTTPGFAVMFAKVCKEGTKFYTLETIDAGFDQGIFIDILPYDQLYSDESKRKRQIQRARRWQSISYLYHSYHITTQFRGFKKGLFDIVFRVAHVLIKATLSQEYIVKKFDTNCRIPEQEASDYYLTLTWPNATPYKRSELVEPDSAFFENREYPVPHNLTGYLEKTYGDWETIPPKEDQRTHKPLVLEFENN
jgi:lipopolysaccharide cholinephosphotransferase